jgi:hypothetical protein
MVAKPFPSQLLGLTTILQVSIHDQAEKCADIEGTSLNQFITLAMRRSSFALKAKQHNMREVPMKKRQRSLLETKRLKHCNNPVLLWTGELRFRNRSREIAR